MLVAQYLCSVAQHVSFFCPSETLECCDTGLPVIVVRLACLATATGRNPMLQRSPQALGCDALQGRICHD